jgi:hypothetical protein
VLRVVGEPSKGKLYLSIITQRNLKRDVQNSKFKMLADWVGGTI